MLADVTAASASGAPAAQFLTVQTLFTAAGTATSVIAVTTILQGLIPRLPLNGSGLVLAFVITLFAVQVRGEEYTGVNIFVAIMNGFVVYAAAVGVNNVADAPTGSDWRAASTWSWQEYALVAMKA
jgi:hypothetical protein